MKTLIYITLGVWVLFIATLFVPAKAFASQVVGQVSALTDKDFHLVIDTSVGDFGVRFWSPDESCTEFEENNPSQMGTRIINGQKILFVHYCGNKNVRIFQPKTVAGADLLDQIAIESDTIIWEYYGGSHTFDISSLDKKALRFRGGI